MEDAAGSSGTASARWTAGCGVGADTSVDGESVGADDADDADGADGADGTAPTSGADGAASTSGGGAAHPSGSAPSAAGCDPAGSSAQLRTGGPRRGAAGSSVRCSTTEPS